MPSVFYRCCWLLLLLASSAPAAELPSLTEARQALAEALPKVALFKLRNLLATPDFPTEQRSAATLLLGQALAASGASGEALSTIQPLVSAGDLQAIFLRASVLATQERWAEARPLYHAVAARPGVPVAATVGEAEALQALGRTKEAARLLEIAVRKGGISPLVRVRWAVLLTELRQSHEAEEALGGFAPKTPEETKWKHYAEGRLLLLQDQPAPALRLFADILEQREFLPENLLVAATFGAVDAHLALHGSENADDVLEAFIWRYASSAYLASAFRRLDQIYAQEEHPSDNELRKWAQKGPSRRAALGQFYLGKAQVRQGKWEKAAATLDTFVRKYPADTNAAEAYRLRAEVYETQGNYPEAVRSLEAAMRLTTDDALRPTIELRTGLAHFQQGEFLLSANLFEDAARHSDRLRPVATFDATLAWLHVKNLERFREGYRAFIELQPESPLRAELLLEEGLVQARHGDPQSAESLRAFLRDYPQSVRRPEARLALAELSLLGQSGPGLSAAEQYFQVADTTPPPPEIAAQADYLAIFLADAREPQDDARVIALAKKFLQERPGASQAPEVRLKLGQVYFRHGDFANAETQFATEAENLGPSTEVALFLAGESAMKLINTGAVDRALGYFDRVVKMEGSFKLYARQEQAIVQKGLEHEDQAIALYDLILSSPEVDPELWQAAQCGKGDCLLALGGRAQPGTERLGEAVAVFDLLARSPGVSAPWRNQALYKKAKALERLSRGDEAMATFYDVLNGPQIGEREFFWFYKAGFDAARVYEQQENWKSAIGIYQKMAKLEGPRTAEAKSRLRKVRLDHFIWE